MVEPEEFIEAYADALGTQDWRRVDPLVHKDACVTFSNGTVHKGKAQVQKAFEANFSLIKDEQYSISNVHWVMKSQRVARDEARLCWSRKPTNGSCLLST